MFSKSVGLDFQYRSNGKNYYKVYVVDEYGKRIKGSRTLHTYTGQALQRVIRETEEAIEAGAWDLVPSR